MLVSKGCFTLKHTTVGSRTFVGNNAVLVTGSQLANNCLIGVCSTPPPPGTPMPNDSSWVGSPSFLLPRRKVVDADESATYKPSCLTWSHRAAWEFCKIFFPPLLNGGFYLASVISFVELYAACNYAVFLAVLPLITFGYGLVMCFIVFALKWILIGKFRVAQYPLWSSPVWKSEFVQSLEENVCAPAFLRNALGTWWAAQWFRLNGANVGHRAYIATIYLTEPDLITIEEDAAVEEGATIQTRNVFCRVLLWPLPSRSILLCIDTSYGWM